MQPGSPYHLIEAIGSCQVGSVWSAIDPQGRSLMVALLDPNVAIDQRWREAFQEAANALVQAGEPGWLYADFASGAPWVAYSAENGIGAERVFLALGMDFQQVPPDGTGPLDHAPYEPATQVTPPPAPPEQPTAPAQQPLPPGIIDTATPAEAPPTTVFPPVQPGPPAAEQAQPVAAQQPPAQPPAPAAPQSAPPAPAAPAAESPVDDFESTQPTQRMHLPPTAQAAPPVTPWAGSAAPQSAPPVSQQPSPVSTPPATYGQPTSGAPHPVSGAPHPVSGAPTSVPPHPTSVPPHPISGGPRPVSGTPMSPAYGQPLSPAYAAPAPAYGPHPPHGPAPYDPYAPVAPPPPRRSRTGMWIGIAVAVLVLIAGGGGVYAWSASGGDPNPPANSASASALPPEAPTGPPVSPGIEPPKPGKWPENWPHVTERDNVKTLSSLDGLGFALKVPQDWDCALAGKAQGFVRYSCGARQGQPNEIGGELIVRDCPQPCNDQQQTTMRMAEEAWGVPWTRTGQYTTIGEQLLDGEQRHALIVVAYWRGGSDGVVNKQLVLRMTSPVREAQELRRIATYLRDVLVF
ncbi:hypothetical protein [Phytohabitans houttuyneae]|uniref:Uncharacterized protein n=1 Tax=Phytohabitans houttuyneae TaxID=1076126 RepID=A0A6V8KK42_9ACTN|nr:hypothetical protein [Phytohabitans houttuyneae]GFJ85503.1 hypothetical protein Phou_096830 [Phytohabitans houttuyneae]